MAKGYRNPSNNCFLSRAEQGDFHARRVVFKLIKCEQDLTSGYNLKV